MWTFSYLRRWWYQQNLVVSVNIGCRDNFSVTSYIIKDTVRYISSCFSYFFMFFFLRYTKWLISPGKFILNNNISSTYKVQTNPPPLSQYKNTLNTKILLFWEFQNFPFDHFHRMMILYIPVGDVCENIHQQWQWEKVTWQGVSAPSRYHNTKHFSHRLPC